MRGHNVLGWIVGLDLFLVGQIFVPAAVCSDGWASPSIGRQGACSHHGGVSGASGLMQTLVFLGSVASGVYVSNTLNPNPTNRDGSDQRRTYRPRPQPKRPRKSGYREGTGRKRFNLPL
jgi:hypothetical protein